MAEIAEAFANGGPFMFALVLAGLIHMALVIAQLALSKKIDLMPMVWAGLLGILILGLLGTFTGMMQAFKAVGMASPEQKQALLASAVAIAIITTEFALILAAIGTFFSGLAGVVTRKRLEKPA